MLWARCLNEAQVASLIVNSITCRHDVLFIVILSTFCQVRTFPFENLHFSSRMSLKGTKISCKAERVVLYRNKAPHR